MKYLTAIVLAMPVLFVSLALVHAGGDSARGKKLFNDPALGGSTNAKSCNTCHPEGARLEKAAKKTDFPDFGTKDIKDVVNACIKAPLKGKPIDKNSQDMEDIVAYIRSLEGK